MKESISSKVALSRPQISGRGTESTSFPCKLGTSMVRLKGYMFGREPTTDSCLDPHDPPRKRQATSVRRLASATPSNKTKMIHGQSYAIDAELLLERHRCELACRNFNRWETESAPLSSTNLGL